MAIKWLYHHIRFIAHALQLRYCHESSSYLFSGWGTSLKTSLSLRDTTQFHSFLLNFTSSYFSQSVSVTNVIPNSSCSFSQILPVYLCWCFISLPPYLLPHSFARRNSSDNSKVFQVPEQHTLIMLRHCSSNNRGLKKTTWNLPPSPAWMRVSQQEHASHLGSIYF